MNTSKMNKLYNLVFGNIVLTRLIYEYVELYKRNNHKVFKSRKSLLIYNEREYISKITYSGKDKLRMGDLPIGGVLKQVKFPSFQCNQIDNRGELIPDGVEILEFNYTDTIAESICTPFSTLPTSIHTIKNAIYISNLNDGSNTIPSNITSISFIHCNCPLSYLNLPNTIQTLEFNEGTWNNNGKTLVKGDIPEGVTKLSLSEYAICKLSPDTLPISTNELSIQYTNTVIPGTNKINNFDFMVNMNIKKLEINQEFNMITPESNLCKCNSLESISIILGIGKSLKPNSLPCENLTDLTLSNITCTNLKFEQDTIPKSVLNLKLNFSRIRSTTFETIRKSIPDTVTSLLLNINV